MMKALRNKTTGLITALELRSTKNRVAYVIMVLIAVIACLICVLPIVWIILASLKSMEEFFRVPPTFIPRKLELNKLGEVWKEISGFRLYTNSMIMLVGDVSCAIVFNGLGGYVISRLKPKGTTVLLVAVLWTMMMPNSISLVPLFKTFLDFPVVHANLTNSYIPMWIMSAANCYYILLFKNFFDTIPSAYVEAAKIDGCSNFMIFARIIAPLSGPIMMVVAIFSAMASIDNFLWPYLLIKDSTKYTISVNLYHLKSLMPMDKQVVAAFFAILPSAILFIIFQKYIMSTDSGSGVKG